MLKDGDGLTDREKLFRDERWQTADEAIPGVRLIMEREGSRFFRANPKGPGTFIGRKDGSKRLIKPEEFKDASIYAKPLADLWKIFKDEFQKRTMEQYREKTKRPKSDMYHLWLSGCHYVKVPPDWKSEEKREVTLTVEFQLSEGLIVCYCDPAHIWEGKTLRICTKPGEPPLIDGERAIEAGVAAQELLNEFTDRLEPCRS
jgi:hypothetical protein